MAEVSTAAHRRKIPLHLDGARIFNAALALETTPKEIASSADTVSFCLSKGLGCPVGSLLCGSREFIASAHRTRKVLGGGMRQAGIIAAAGIVALTTMVDRLAEDHQNARALAQGLALVAGLNVRAVANRTNMVVFDVDGDADASRRFAAAMKERGVLISPREATSFRAVTHNGISRADIDRAVAAAAQADRRSFRRLKLQQWTHSNRLFSLRGHRGLVTGASSGLGVECAKALAIAGADVALVARRKDRVVQIADELAKAHGVKAIGIGADVTREDDLDRVMAEASAALGDVDILVNNAGVSPTGRAENFKREAWDQTLAVNLTAPMMLSQRFARRLIEIKQPGRIINMASIYASVASSVYRLSAYVATKAALANLTRQLAVEWAGYGILVNAIAPGWIPTEATEGGIAKPANKERMEAFTPMKRLGLAHEIRGAVIFLASPASSYVTGSVISVDGGYQAW